MERVDGPHRVVLAPTRQIPPSASGNGKNLSSNVTAYHEDQGWGLSERRLSQHALLIELFAKLPNQVVF